MDRFCFIYKGHIFRSLDLSSIPLFLIYIYIYIQTNKHIYTYTHTHPTQLNMQFSTLFVTAIAAFATCSEAIPVLVPSTNQTAALNGTANATKFNAPLYRTRAQTTSIN